MRIIRTPQNKVSLIFDKLQMVQESHAVVPASELSDTCIRVLKELERLVVGGVLGPDEGLGFRI